MIAYVYSYVAPYE